MPSHKQKAPRLMLPRERAWSLLMMTLWHAHPVQYKGGTTVEVQIYDQLEFAYNGISLDSLTIEFCSTERMLSATVRSYRSFVEPLSTNNSLLCMYIRHALQHNTSLFFSSETNKKAFWVPKISQNKLMNKTKKSNLLF